MKIVSARQHERFVSIQLADRGSRRKKKAPPERGMQASDRAPEANGLLMGANCRHLANLP
jgi:hypothetical protein